MKKNIPKIGNGKGMKKFVLIIWEWESEAFILGNGPEREFPLTPAKMSDGFLSCYLELSSCSMHFSIQNGSDGKQTKAGQDAGEAALVDRGSRVLGASGHIPPVHPHTPP